MTLSEGTSLVSAVLLALSAGAQADHVTDRLTFVTLITTPLAIEGLTADASGNLYTPGRAGVAGAACPVWRVNLREPALVVVGFVPAPSPTTQCSPSGLAFNASGELFIADGSTIWQLTPNEATPRDAVPYAANVPGTNGLAFDRDGQLWTGDGGTGQGRVWKISPDGTVTEVFRIPPMRNSTALGGVVAGEGAGRQVRTFPPGTAANTAGAQDLVANGLLFTREGDLVVADTARGALWRVSFDRHGALENAVGCDTTLAPDTLCLDSVWVAHPALEGADGIALDRAGNVWVDANERQAVVVVSRTGRVTEVFRNPPAAATLLRNEGPLEFPASPVLVDRTFCTSSSDNERRDNSPRAAGEVNGGAGPQRAKISCAIERLDVRGVTLPVD
jgi:sugar lactone lactonase YvrE